MGPPKVTKPVPVPWGAVLSGCRRASARRRPQRLHLHLFCRSGSAGTKPGGSLKRLPPKVPQLRERGVTLIELLIALTLVAALSVGMLMAMRTSLITLDKTESRLDDNRRTMGIEQMLIRQIGGVMPVASTCGAAFGGSSNRVRFVTSYSMAEGARGYPRILELGAVPDPQGGVRLVASEHLYSGPASLTPYCGGAKAAAGDTVLVARLAFCRIAYRDPVTGDWLADWGKADLPAAVRIDMAAAVPDAARMPVVAINVPIHVTREVMATYEDQ